jgi:hypothetical protein
MTRPPRTALITGIAGHDGSQPEVPFDALIKMRADADLRLHER